MKTLIAILALFLVVNALQVYFSVEERKQTNQLRERLNNIYRDEILVLEDSLERAGARNILADRRIDSLVRVHETLRIRLNETAAELSRVKGRYNKLSSDELSKEMIKRHVRQAD